MTSLQPPRQIDGGALARRLRAKHREQIEVERAKGVVMALVGWGGFLLGFLAAALMGRLL